MYGSRADCLSPCDTMYGTYLHWPTVGASILAVLGIGRAIFHVHSLVEAFEEQLKPLGITHW
jgi:hypothetical protein